MRKTQTRHRVARTLTRKQFLEARKIGDIEKAHAQMGICKGTLYTWKKCKTWPKFVAYKAAMSAKVKSKTADKKTPKYEVVELSPEISGLNFVKTITDNFNTIKNSFDRIVKILEKVSKK